MDSNTGGVLIGLIVVIIVCGLGVFYGYLPK
jgi:hypothetical protein